MKKQSYIPVILAIASAALSFFAPLAKETTEGLFSTYTKTVSLFSGVDSGFCVALTVFAGICFILFSVIGLLEDKGITGARISGIALLAMQIICSIQAMNYYDDSSLLGALRSEVSEMSIHPLAIISMIITLIAVIICFMAQRAEPVQKNESEANVQ